MNTTIKQSALQLAEKVKTLQYGSIEHEAALNALTELVENNISESDYYDFEQFALKSTDLEIASQAVELLSE